MTISGTSRTSCAATASPDADPGEVTLGCLSVTLHVFRVTNQNDFHHNRATTAVLVWISLPEAHSLSW